MEQAKSVMYFILAGLCEIGGGYLVWLWLREHRSIWYAVLGHSFSFSTVWFQPFNQPISAVSTLRMAGYLLFYQSCGVGKSMV